MCHCFVIVDIDECASDPCMHPDWSGLCTDSINGYTCSCTDGIEGDNCETGIELLSYHIVVCYFYIMPTLIGHGARILWNYMMFSKKYVSLF